MEIELADAVAALRDELVGAAKRRVGQEIAFTVGPIELEFAVELRQDAKASRPAVHQRELENSLQVLAWLQDNVGDGGDSSG